MKEPLLVSACLLGLPCRYDGQSKGHIGLEKFLHNYTLVAFCPEFAGGLSTPRAKSERRGQQVFSQEGRDVTAAFQQGAEKALVTCQTLGIKKALLKEGSPSCGVQRIYDGSFSGQSIPGSGMTAELLASKGIDVFSSEDFKV